MRRPELTDERWFLLIRSFPAAWLKQGVRTAIGDTSGDSICVPFDFVSIANDPTEQVCREKTERVM